METLEIFGLQFVFSLGVFALIAKFYLVPWLAEKPLEGALAILIIPHMFRHIGLSFLVPNLNGQPLPEFFASTAAYGDLLSAVLAIVAIIVLRAGWGRAILMVWFFNLVGTFDLLNALRQAEAVPNFGATWYIPTFLVPALLVTHALIFARLIKTSSNTSS